MTTQIPESHDSAFDFLHQSNLLGFLRLRPDGLIVEANEVFLGLIGYSREEMVGKMTYHAFTPPEFLDSCSQIHQQVIQQGTTQPFEKDYIRKDGKRITVMVGSVRTGTDDDVVGFILDITGRKENERALDEAYTMLRRSESRFRRLMDANVIGVGFFHLDGRFLDANDALLQIAGFTRAELEAGQFRWDLLTPAEFRHLDARAIQELQSTGKCTPYEKEYLLRDGRRVPILIAAAYLEKSPQEGFCFVLDNSARHAAERALQEAHRTLEQRVTERTAELARSESRLRESEEYQRKIAEHNQRLVREVEHRVRNNLAGLVGLVGVMREKASSLQNFADAIETRLRAMAHVHQVLAEGGWDSVGLQSLIESTLASLSYVSPHCCDLSVAGPPVVIAAQHALPLTLIFAEWFTNASKYGCCAAKDGNLAVHWTIAKKGKYVDDPPNPSAPPWPAPGSPSPGPNKAAPQSSIPSPLR